MNNTLKIALSCASGSGIGTLLATEFGAFWLIGAIIGGAVGYLIFEFNRVLSAFGRAWNTVSDWEPDWKRVKEACVCSFYLATVFFSILAAITALDHASGDVKITWVEMIFLAILLIVVYIFAGTITSQQEYNVNIIRSFAKYASPLLVYFLIKWAWWAVTHLDVCSEKLSAAWKKVKLFAKTVLISIHSELRVLCFVDSILGALTGYFFGSALIGAIAGAVFGVASFWLISIKLLGLKFEPKS